MSVDFLPIDEILAPLLRALRSTQAVVVEAPPGAGKTTRLPRALLAAGCGEEREIWVAQPRGMVARLAAEQVARELGEQVGHRVGYQLRFAQQLGPHGQLRFVTDGVLLERLASAERGTGLGVVVLDDFHERRVASDLSLVLLRRRLAVDAKLRIIVLSAPGDSAALSKYLGDCPRLRCPEPLAVPQVEHEASSSEAAPLAARVASAVERVVQSAPAGDVLVFLPGAVEIERAKHALRATATERGIELVPLHGEQPAELAARALAPGQRRRVVLASSLAESLAVPGVSTVVDAGLALRAACWPWTERRQLELQPSSRAAAARRAARAGAAEGAQVLRLYSHESWLERAEQEQPELLRLDLAGVLLVLYACKVPVSAELWLDAPPEAALCEARAQLERLGLASGGRVTDLGRRASVLPLTPRLARVALEGAELGIPRRSSLAAALLAERDIRQERAGELGLASGAGDCDIDYLIALYTEAEAAGFAPAALHQLGLRSDRVEDVRRCYERVLGNLTARNPAAQEDALDAAATRQALGLALLSAFPERVAGRGQGGEAELLLSTEHVAWLAPQSVVRSNPFLLALDVEERPPQPGGAAEPALWVRVASSIEVEWLTEHASSGLSERELLEWDAEREMAILISQLCWGAVVLRESTRPAYPGIVTGPLVERAALEQLDTLFSKADALPEIVARSELVAQHLPELELQRVNELGTRGLLRAACLRVISIAELRELDWGQVFLDQLSPEQRRQLERLAPREVVLEGGRRLRVVYARGQAPYIESRLQDFFGMREGPSIVDGRVPLTLRLLAPNERAVQITANLASFWERDYADLRRELSRRYPRDAWPEEPRTATAPAPNRPG